MRKQQTGNLERQLHTLKYFLSGGPHFTEKAIAEANRILLGPCPAPKRNIVKALGLDEGREHSSPERQLSR